MVVVVVVVVVVGVSAGAGARRWPGASTMKTLPDTAQPTHSVLVKSSTLASIPHTVIKYALNTPTTPAAQLEYQIRMPLPERRIGF